MKQTVNNKIRERTIEAELVRRVLALGGLCEKVRVIGKRGWPDRFCALPGGIIVLVETKRPRGGRLAVHQKQYHEKLEALGVAVVVIKNLEQIEQLVQSVRVKKRATTR